MTDAQSNPTITPDPLWRSWRGGAILASVLTFWQAAASLYAKVEPMMADGLTPFEAIDILNASGPMLAASSDLWVMALSAIAGLTATISKIKQWIKTRRNANASGGAA